MGNGFIFQRRKSRGAKAQRMVTNRFSSRDVRDVREVFFGGESFLFLTRCAEDERATRRVDSAKPNP